METLAGAASVVRIREEALLLRAISRQYMPSRRSKKVEVGANAPERIRVLWEVLGYSASSDVARPDPATAEKVVARLLRRFHKEDGSYPLKLESVPRPFRVAYYDSDETVAITDESAREADPAIWEFEIPATARTQGALTLVLPSYLHFVAHSTLMGALGGVQLVFPGLKLNGERPLATLIPNAIRVDEQTWLVSDEPVPDAPPQVVVCRTFGRAVELVVQSGVSEVGEEVRAPGSTFIRFEGYTPKKHDRLFSGLRRLHSSYVMRGQNHEASHWLGYLEGAPVWIRINHAYGNGSVATEPAHKRKISAWIGARGLKLK